MVKILFLCTGNSCRSQMAEGLARYYLSDKIIPYSAGTKTHGLNKRAVRIMKEIGVNISHHQSKTINEIGEDFDYVITVCSHAHETCPYFPAKTQVIHQGFDDPPFLTRNMDNEEEILSVYRRVRDEIKEYILTLPEKLNML